MPAETPEYENLDSALKSKLTALIEEGRDIAYTFDLEVRQKNWHPFVAADYDVVLRRLLPMRESGLRFLECGSATGVITIMADLLGFDACGIEIDGDLVKIARRLAEKYRSGAQFAAGSFLPTGYEYRDKTGDHRTGTLGGTAESGYLLLGRPLEDFDVVFAYPWDGEAAVIEDLMKRYGAKDARLLLHGGTDIEIFRGKRRALVP